MALPAAEFARLSTFEAAPKIYLNHNRQALAESICGDLARWALERNCRTGEGELLHYHQAINGTTSPDALKHLELNRGHHHHHHHLHLNHHHHNDNYHSLLASDNADLKASSPLSEVVVGHLLEPMFQLESKVNYYFSDIWLSSGDSRTNKLPLIGAGPWKLLYATLIYLYLIKWLLPKLMRPMRALELNWPIRLYNLFMVLANMWAFYHGARILNFGSKCFGCETINHHDNSAQAIELLHYGWLFFISRLVEWLDTIFFVLRKKERQVTKLHVFHHSFVPLISWTYLKYHPGYTVAFFPFVNTFVHSIMYTYYLLATFGPKIQPYLWWKRYLTSLQIAQFVLIIIQLASIPLTGDDSCQYPRGFLLVAIAGAVLFLWLFYTYYRETYSKSKQQQQQQQHQQQLAGGSLAGKTEANINESRAIKRRVSFARQKSTSGQSAREGSSRSLEDSIDNAIICNEFHNDDDDVNNGSGGNLWKLKLN